MNKLRLKDRLTKGLFIVLFASALIFAAAQDTSSWKHYRNSEYGFEIAYPTDWKFVASMSSSVMVVASKFRGDIFPAGEVPPTGCTVLSSVQ